MKTSTLVNKLSASILIIALSLGGCAEQKSVSESDLDGYWVLKKINTESSKEAFKGALPTLEFDFSNHTLYGTGGCNRYTGTFTLTNNVLSAPALASTEMLCSEENQETRFLLELSKPCQISVEDDVLILRHNDTIVLEFEKGEVITP